MDNQATTASKQHGDMLQITTLTLTGEGKKSWAKFSCVF